MKNELLNLRLENTLIQLGYQNKSEPTFASVKQYDQYCGGGAPAGPATLGKSS
jgi:hypothetical protein